MARAAAEMGCELLHHTLLPGLSPRAAYPTPAEAIPVVAARAREVYDAAERLGVRCVYEDQGYVFNGIQPFLAFLNALDRPAGVVLDVGNSSARCPSAAMCASRARTRKPSPKP